MNALNEVIFEILKLITREVLKLLNGLEYDNVMFDIARHMVNKDICFCKKTFFLMKTPD